MSILNNIAKKPCTLHISFVPLFFAIGIILGSIIAINWKIQFFQQVFWLIFCLIILILAMILPTYFTLALVLFSGVIFVFYRSAALIRDNQNMQKYINQQVILQGTIVEDIDVEKDKIKFKLHNITINGHSYQSQVFVSASIQSCLENSNSSHSDNKSPPQHLPKRSDIVELSGKARDGFGVFSIFISRAKIRKITHPIPGDIALKIRDDFASRVKKFIPSPESSLALGYLLGAKTALPKDLSETLQIIGLTHIVVASGANLSILIEFARKILGKISRFAGLLFSTILVISFITMVGLSPSMSRAGIVAFLSLLAWYYGRSWQTWRLLIFVAALTLALNPFYILDLGWLLSFGAFTGILVCSPIIREFFYGEAKINFIQATLIETVSATILCLPILIFYFGSFSILSIVANILILPTISIVMALAFSAGVFSFITLFSQLFGYLAQLILQYHLAIINFFGAQKLFLVKIDKNNLAILAIYFPIFLLLFLLYCINLKQLHSFKNSTDMVSYRYEN